MFDSLIASSDEDCKPLPTWLRLIWLSAAPLGICVSGRILWEKTLLTAKEGEQMIGFSMIHIHPGFFFGGLFCSFVLLAWILPTAYYAVRARLHLEIYDYLMLAGSLFVCFSMFLPDNFGLRLR